MEEHHVSRGKTGEENDMNVSNHAKDHKSQAMLPHYVSTLLGRDDRLTCLRS